MLGPGSRTVLSKRNVTWSRGSDLRLGSASARLRLGLAAHHPEPHIVRRGRAMRFAIRGTIRAAADHLASAVARQHPLGNVAAQIENRLLIVPALAVETAHRLQQGRRPRQLFGRFTELGRILRVCSIARPVVERVFSIALLVEALYFVFIGNSIELLGLFGQPLGIGFGAVYSDPPAGKFAVAGSNL
jgi:hypothetical protein